MRTYAPYLIWSLAFICSAMAATNPLYWIGVFGFFTLGVVLVFTDPNNPYDDEDER